MGGLGAIHAIHTPPGYSPTPLTNSPRCNISVHTADDRPLKGFLPLSPLSLWVHSVSVLLLLCSTTALQQDSHSLTLKVPRYTQGHGTVSKGAVHRQIMQFGRGKLGAGHGGMQSACNATPSPWFLRRLVGRARVAQWYRCSHSHALVPPLHCLRQHASHAPQPRAVTSACSSALVGAVSVRAGASGLPSVTHQ